MKYTVIQSLLMEALVNVSEAQKVRIAPESRAFRPTAQETFLRPHLLMSQPAASGLGQDATNTQRGFFQIDVLSPCEGGWKEPMQLADSICAHFKRGLKLVATGVDLTVQSAGIGPAMLEEERRKLPVSVNFWAFTSND